MSSYPFFSYLRDLPALLNSRPAPVGVYGLPRGGTNFTCAWLHYHPELFCVSERGSDRHKSLRSYWGRRSLFRRNGIQGKKPSQIQRIIFNKVQRFPELWGADVEYPSDTRFIFYLRNPIRIHMSREAFRSKHEVGREYWADSRSNFRQLMMDAKKVLDTFYQLQSRYSCVVYSHEYFCFDHAVVLADIYEFLGIDKSFVASPDKFFQKCGKCGASFGIRKVNNSRFTYCPSCDYLLRGHGHFNPLRKIDLDHLVSEEWKDRGDIGLLVEDMNHFLGLSITDYYLRGDYSVNIPIAIAENR